MRQDAEIANRGYSEDRSGRLEELTNSAFSDPPRLNLRNWRDRTVFLIRVCVLSHRLSTRTNVKFFVDAAHVSVHCVHADVQAIGDLLEQIALSEHVEDFVLPR